MVEVICDTNFLIHLATKRVNNFDRFLIELGTLHFVVPNVVITELNKLKEFPNKKNDIDKTFEFIKKFKKIPINGNYADKEIENFVTKNNSLVATMDKKLKSDIKKIGGTIISLHNNKLILES